MPPARRVLSRFAGAAVLLVAVFTLPAAAADRRVALVLGNGAYQAQPRQDGAVADARAVAEAARRLGFEVVEAFDLDRRGTEEVLTRFYRAVDGAELAFVYYAGHALQLGGRNYLLPTDAALAGPYDFDFETVSLDGVLDYLARHARRRLIVLDAARANGAGGRDFVVGAGDRATVSEPGLAPIAAGPDTLALTASRPGRLAPPGPDGRSAFTAAFLTEFAAAARAPDEAFGRLGAALAERGAEPPAAAGALPAEFRFAARRDLDRFEPVHRVVARRGEPMTALDLALPAAPHDPDLAMVFERMPQAGEIVRGAEAGGGSAVWPGDRLKTDQAAALGYRQAEAPAAAARRVEASFRIDGPLTNPAHGMIEIELTDDPALAAADRQRRQAAARLAAAAVDDFARTHRRIAVEIPVGVGPRPLPLAAAPAPAGDGAARLAVTAAPATGRLALGGIRVAASGDVPLAGLAGLTYEAPVGAEGATATMRLAARGGGRDAEAELTIRTVASRCDRLAGDRLDRQGVAGGRYPHEIDGAAAAAACRRDIAAYGENGRFRLGLGRALLAARDERGARAAFARAAALGHARAHYYLGYLDGIGAAGAVDEAAANVHFRRGAEMGDVYALYSWGKSLFYGRGTARDRARGLDLMFAAAEGGHSYAMNELGAIFEAGDGVARDLERARRWYEAGMRLGDSFSLHNLGLVHLDGKGVPQDHARARALFRRAADAGHAAALNELGRMAFNGWGQPRDLAEAARLYKAAAELGEPYAAYSYAWMLGTGALGGPADLAGAARYLALSAAVERQPRHDIARDARESLARLPQAAKRDALARVLAVVAPKARAGTARADLDRIARLLARHGLAVGRGADLDTVLIAATRAAWLMGNPRLDRF